jgi:hypothetical protein
VCQIFIEIYEKKWAHVMMENEKAHDLQVRDPGKPECQRTDGIDSSSSLKA